MSNLFKNELALMLGILCAKHFKGKIWSYNPPGKPTGGGGCYNPELPRRFYDENSDGTGRGGYYANFNGDFGKPGYGDKKLGGNNVSPSLAASGASLSQGGAGLQKGQFFYGGGNTDGGFNISSGGGGGFYGGGSSMLSGGGGGGSSFVLSEAGLGFIGDDPATLAQVTKNPKYEQFIGTWVEQELRSQVDKYYWLYDLNTSASDELEKYKLQLGDKHSQWVSFKNRVNNHGCILVSNVNDTISFNADNGWEGLAEEYVYDDTNDYIEWTAPYEGNYHFICYGACGGDASRARYELRGGYGGVASGMFYLTAGTKLYFCLGQQGLRNVRANGGGGAGRGGSCGGGGATFISYAENPNSITDYLNSLLIIAGGGGGAYDKNGGNGQEYDFDTLEKITPSDVLSEEKMEEEKEEEETIIENMKFWVNDLSTVHVLVKSFNQEIVPEFAKTSCSIYINDGMEGELHQSVTPHGGVYVKEFLFHLNTIYPENTPTHEVTIQANIKTNFFSFLADKGITIWVTTKDRLTDSSVPKNNLKFSNHVDEIEVSDYYEIELHRKSSNDLEFIDDVDIEDEIIIEKITKASLDNYLNDDEEIEDEISVEMIHLEYIVLDLEEEVDNEDFIRLELVPPVFIQIMVDESTPFGSVDESSYVAYEKYKTFKAYPNGNYLIEWYLDGELISTNSSITVQAIKDITYVVKFIEIAQPTIVFDDLGYINDGILVAFDGLANTRDGHNSNYISALHDLVYTVYNKTGRYAEHSANDVKYDLINNQRTGHSDVISSIHDLVYIAYETLDYYAEQQTTDVRYDGVFTSQYGHISTFSEWLDIAGLEVVTDPIIVAEDTKIKVGTTSQLSYECYNMEDTNITIVSSDDSILSVDADNNLIANSLGDCTVTLYNEYHNISTTINVFVVESVLDEFSIAVNAEGSQLVFVNESAIPWTIDSEYGGVRSGAISHSQSTSISTTIEKNGTLYFDYKVFSEIGYDKLYVYKNDSYIYSYSGSNYAEDGVNFSVVAGDVIKFTYSKDGSASSGSDCAWVRNVHLE